jgi:hypothetical protein
MSGAGRFRVAVGDFWEEAAPGAGTGSRHGEQRSTGAAVPRRSPDGSILSDGDAPGIGLGSAGYEKFVLDDVPDGVPMVFTAS